MHVHICTRNVGTRKRKKKKATVVGNERHESEGRQRGRQDIYTIIYTRRGGDLLLFTPTAPPLNLWAARGLRPGADQLHLPVSTKRAGPRRCGLPPCLGATRATRRDQGAPRAARGYLYTRL